MKARYKGQSFYVEGLTDGKVYEVISIEEDMLRVIDDSGDDYLYDSINPGPLDESSEGGRWEVVEDDEKGTLKELIEGSKKAL